MKLSAELLVKEFGGKFWTKEANDGTIINRVYLTAVNLNKMLEKLYEESTEVKEGCREYIQLSKRNLQEKVFFDCNEQKLIINKGQLISPFFLVSDLITVYSEVTTGIYKKRN